MRHVRLAGAIVILLAALAGGHAAGATTLCGVSTAPCASANVVPSGTALALESVRRGGASSEEAVLTVNVLGTLVWFLTCKTGTENSAIAPAEEAGYGAGTAGASPTTGPVPWQVTDFHLSHCQGSATQPCTVTFRNLPWTASFTVPSSGSGADYSLSVAMPSGVAGSRSMTLTCPWATWSPCDFGGMTITASGYNPLNPNRPDLTGPDAGHGQVYFSLVPLTRQAGACTSASLTMADAIYRGTALNDLPGDVWVR